MVTALVRSDALFPEKHVVGAGVLHTGVGKLGIVQHATLPMMLMSVGNAPAALQIVPFAGLEHARHFHRLFNNHFVIVFVYLVIILYLIEFLRV